MASDKEVAAFRRAVWDHYKKEGRHDLPWRKTRDPYRILVSEMMLQQTQVHRVLPKYKEFLRKFPTVRSLAKAPLSEVLKVWSGLGYNRRAKYLLEAAKILAKKPGYWNSAATEKEWPLPGVGPYTRAAVRTFAFNEPHTMIETNIRSAYIHHFYPKKKRVNDRELLVLIESAAEGQDPREWHWALMDYGAHLKKLHPNPTRRSAHYHVQTKFKGSLREIRGEIIRLLTKGSYGDLALSQTLTFDESGMRMALRDLQKDGLIVAEKGSWRLA
jgi:A/G-specific adenine glycosylase